MSLGFILVLGLGSKVKTSPWLCQDVFDAAAMREAGQEGKWQRFKSAILNKKTL